MNLTNFVSLKKGEHHFTSKKVVSKQMLFLLDKKPGMAIFTIAECNNVAFPSFPLGKRGGGGILKTFYYSHRDKRRHLIGKNM